MTRIRSCFETLKTENRKALVVFITAGDPDLESTKSILDVIDDSGADIVELGVPFSDPLADGPIIQASALRSLKSGTTLKKIPRPARPKILSLSQFQMKRKNDFRP